MSAELRRQGNGDGQSSHQRVLSLPGLPHPSL